MNFEVKHEIRFGKLTWDLRSYNYVPRSWPENLYVSSRLDLATASTLTNIFKGITA